MRFSMFFVAASVALLAVHLSFCTALPPASEEYSDHDTDSSLGDSPTETPSATQRDSAPASELPTSDAAESIETKSASTSQNTGRSAQPDPTTVTSPTTSYPFFGFPCDSFLRPVLPQYFLHCDCLFTAYSEWTTSSFRQVPTYQCASGYVVVETRNRSVISGICHDETQERTAECEFIPTACSYWCLALQHCK